MKQRLLWMLAAILFICGVASLAFCTATDDRPATKETLGPSENPAGRPAIERVTERGTLLVGTTGDYRPLSYKEADGTLRQLHEKYGLMYDY